MASGQERAHYPDEVRHPWLTMLLDAYSLFEKGTRGELARAERTRAKKLACHAGCDACCRRPSVPMTELEIMGVTWYLMGLVQGERRAKIRELLAHCHESIACPFLLDGFCVVYPVRPLACRILHVFGPPCTPEEIPIESRPQDIWTPSREATRPAVYEMLAYFGFHTLPDKQAALNNGYIPAHSRLMSELAWEKVDFDAPLP
jgi:uncharacterized protein